MRQQTNASYLPDCRAYELVSPENAGALLLFPGEVTEPYAEFLFKSITTNSPPNALGQATSPARFGFFGYAGVINGLHPPNGLIDRYVSTRTDAGWVTTYPGRPGSDTLVAVNPLCSNTLDRCIDYQNEFQSEGHQPSSEAPFVWDVNGEGLGRWPTNLSVVSNGESYVGDKRPSADFTHFVFSSRNAAFAPGGLETAPGSVYDNDVEGKTISIVSEDANGDPIAGDTGPSDEYIKIPAVSSDGSHILMSTLAPAGNIHLYMRVDDAVTYEIGNGAGVKFAGMTADGSEVAFTSPQQLTSDDTDVGNDLFVWNEATKEITRVSQGNGNGNSDACSAQWTGLCDVQTLTTLRPELDDALASRSGDIFFYSPEQLDPTDPGVLNEKNLYLYRNGQAHYVATLDPGTKVDRMQISPDGAHAAFLTAARLTNYDNVSPATPSGDLTAWREIYTYDAEANEVDCASCMPTGEPPKNDYEKTGSFITNVLLKDVMASTSGRFMSDDGRVAFATADALVPADTNGKIDVYEYVDNRPQLITNGTGDRDMQSGTVVYPSTHVGLEGISTDGVDLYFSTFESLVGTDRNGSFIKFYDARTNGGFPFVPPALPCSAADECHGDTSPKAVESQVGTAAELNSSAADVQEGSKKKKPHRKKRHGRHQKRDQKQGQGGRHG